MSGKAYVTAGNIDRKVALWKRALSPYERHPFDLRAENSALLVVDMQLYFTEKASHAHVPAAEAIIPRIQDMIAAFRQRGRPVIFTRHSHRHGEEGVLGVWWKDTIRDAAAQSWLDPRLDTTGSPVIRKTRYSAFFGTDLHARLWRLGVRTPVIAGVNTHLCCETTARDAFMRDLQPVVLMDATATDDETLHLSSLRTLADGFAEVLTCAELKRRLGWA
jgi:nicotinamidase-related amidase